MTDRNRGQNASEIPRWSWIVSALGLVIVAVSVGFMLYQAFGDDPSPPVFSIETDSVVQSGSGFLVRIRVTNRGGSAAAGLTIEGVLKGTATMEASTVTMDYLPAGSQRRAGLLFNSDPRKFDLQLRAKGYQEP